MRGPGTGSSVPEAVKRMIVLFREVAEADLDEAIAYYEAIDLDLAFPGQDRVDHPADR